MYPCVSMGYNLVYTLYHYISIPLHNLLLFGLNLCYNLMKKSKLKILANRKIHCLGIVKTKQNIYGYTIEKYKRKISYLQKNNS